LHTIINLSETDFVTFVENQKKKNCRFHLKHNSFYGDFAKEALLKIGTKYLFYLRTSNTTAKQTFRFFTTSIYTNKTSGSSGTPFSFTKDKYTHALTWASNMYRFGWFDSIVPMRVFMASTGFYWV
jgi:phenylacetate-CoA ligase